LRWTPSATPRPPTSTAPSEDTTVPNCSAIRTSSTGISYRWTWRSTTCSTRAISSFRRCPDGWKRSSIPTPTGPHGSLRRWYRRIPRTKRLMRWTASTPNGRPWPTGVSPTGCRSPARQTPPPPSGWPTTGWTGSPTNTIRQRKASPYSPKYITTRAGKPMWTARRRPTSGPTTYCGPWRCRPDTTPWSSSSVRRSSARHRPWHSQARSSSSSDSPQRQSMRYGTTGVKKTGTRTIISSRKR
jgi:Predicted membrane protein